MKIGWRRNLFGIAFQTALLYGILGATWILLSDRILRALVTNPAALQQWELFKGWGFIGVTALLLYFGLRAQLAKLEQESAARRQAMEALRVSEERFQFAMRGTNDGVWDWNLEDDTLYLSPRYKLMLGFQPGELADSLDTWRALTHPDDYPRVLEQMKGFRETQSEFFETEFRMRHKNGHWVDILSRSFAIRRDARIVRFVGTHVDLTGRKQAEDKLRRQEALYRSVLNSVRDVVFQGDLEGRWTFLNSAWEEITGWPVAESLGRSFAEFVHPDDREENLRLVEPMLRREKQFCQHAVRYLQKDGAFRWVEVHAQLISNPDGDVVGIAGTVRDITERRARDEELRKSEEHLRQAAAVAGVGTFEHNHITNAVYMSPLLREIHGFSESEPITMASFMDRVYPEDRPALASAIHHAHNPGGDGRFAVDLRLVPRLGEIRWLRSRSQSFFEGEGTQRRLVRTIGAAVDITELKQAERDVRERETLYRAIIETSADGFLMLDSDRRILEVNDAYVRRSGYSREELLEHCLDDLEAGAPSETMANRMDLIRRNGADLFETFHAAKDGTAWQAEVDVSFWPIAGGRLFAFVRDVNERKQSESLLRIRVELSRLAESVAPEELLHRALDRIELLTGSRISCIHFVDPCANVITLQACSSAARELIGHQFSREQLPVNEMALLARAIETRAPVVENSCDTEHLRIDTIAAPLRLLRRVAVPVFQQGSITAIVSVANKTSDYGAADVTAVQEIAGIVLDLFARRRAERALQDSEERYRALVETTFDWIWEIDADGCFTFSSAKVLKLLGFAASDLAGRRFTTIMDPAEAGRFDKATAGAFRSHTGFADLESECVHRDGRRIILQSSAVPVFDSEGRFRGFRGSSRNITERKLAEKHREALETQLRQSQKMEAIGTLAGGVAHDFNNILTVIHGNASLLLNPAAQLNRSDCAQQIVRAAERAAGLTRQLLMFSRKQVMQVSNVNLNNIVATTTKMLQRILGEDITLQTTYSPQVSLIRADAGMIEQILMNLVVNARDAMPNGGQLNIATGAGSLTEEQARQSPEASPGPHVWLSVTDTGTGIDPDVLARIFEPFFTTKEVGKGTGLGLATVYGIVKQHHGWISVHSELGKGASFKICFPATNAALPEPKRESDTQELPRGKGEMLLIVEDDVAVRELIILLLERCNYRVVQASSGRAALELWKKHHADVRLLLTDLVMPDGVTGLELADAVRRERPALPVMYVTGYSAELAAKGARLVEGVNFLQKPFSPERLARAIRMLLDQADSRTT